MTMSNSESRKRAAEAMHDADGWNTGPETAPMTPDRLAEIRAWAKDLAARDVGGVVLELVAEVEKLSAIVDELADAHKSAHEDWSKAWAERDAARAEVRALRERIAGKHGQTMFCTDCFKEAIEPPPPTTPREARCTCGESTPTVTTPGPCYWAENAPGVQSQVHCPPPATPRVSTEGPASDLISHAAGIILKSMDEPYTAPGHWAGALWKAGMLVHPGTSETEPLTATPREELADAVRALADEWEARFERSDYSAMVMLDEPTHELRAVLERFGLSDPPAGAATPPTTADLPTTPGSVIEARDKSGSVRLFMRGGHPWWVSELGRTEYPANFELVRVLFDAERGE